MPSLASRLIRLGFRWQKVKDAYRTDSPDYLRMRKRDFHPQDVRRVFGSSFVLETFSEGRAYLYGRDKREGSTPILWFPGGAFSLGPFKQQFSRLKELCDRTRRWGVLLDYPKTPEFTHREIGTFVQAALERYSPQGGAIGWGGVQLRRGRAGSSTQRWTVRMRALEWEISKF